MRCLSLREPWATAIFRLGKNVENRTWRTNFRGQLGIHVSRNVDTDSLRDLKLTTRDLFPLGCVVGFVELYDITENSQSTWAREDQFHWLIRSPILLPKPFPCRGQVQLFEADVRPFR